MTELEGEVSEERRETRTPDKDARFSVDSALSETDPASGGRNVARQQEETEQLQQLHLSQQQQLYKDQLDQLKTFKAQLVRDVLTQLSPCPGTQLGAPRLSVRANGSPEASLSLGEAGRLLYPLSVLPPHLSPPTVTTPVRAGVSSEEFIKPLPLPLYSAPIPSLAPSPVVSTLHTPNNAPTSQPQYTVSPPPLEEGSLFSTPVLQSPLSSQPQYPPISRVSYSPNTTTNSTIRTRAFQPVPITDTSRNSFLTHPTSCPMPPHLRSQGVSFADTESEVKAVPIEKHTRHVEDLKSYYESQLAELTESLQADKFPGLIPSASTYSGSPLNRTATSPSSVNTASRGHSPMVATASAATLVTDNERLKSKCADLESKLQQSNLVRQTLEAQVAKQHQCLLEWQSQAEASSQTVAVLQDRLKSNRTQLQQQDSIVEQLQADLQVSVGEIQFWKDQRTQDAEKLKRLCVDIEELQQQNESLETIQRSLREELSTAHREVGRLDAALKTSVTQEHTLKSTVHKLEDQIRHLEHVNNRLHSQATHYSLGSPFPKNPNTPDDAKLQRRSPPSVSPLHTPPPRLTTAHPLSTPPSAHHNPHMQAEVSKSAPLNRRKWLQPSDPGLILGMAPPPTSPQTRHTHQHPSNTTSSPLLQSTGQTLVRQASDSGSSNEGEDPTSLTRRSYINGDPGRASGDDSLLVNSTLSAIHSGKIRRESSGQPARKQEKESMEERVRRSLREVSEAEQRLADLHREKENLESALQRAPRHVTRESKQAKLETEQRLEEVIRQIGSVKMTLRSHHALRK